MENEEGGKEKAWMTKLNTQTFIFSKPSLITRVCPSVCPSVEILSRASENLAVWIFHINNMSLADSLSFSATFRRSTNMSVSTGVNGKEKSRCSFLRGGGSFTAALIRATNKS
jgi:hypothetical protein